MTKFFITTPIYYINDKPHVGHAYSTIAADVLARWYRPRLGKDNVFFSVGLDENSKKTEVSAKAANLTIKEYADSMAREWQSVWDKLGISYSRFIRTTEPAHETAVSDLVQKIYQKGDIYKGQYKGWYCYKCEEFYKEEELKDKKCPVHNSDVEFITEENYFFRLSKYQELLKTYINDHPEFILPESRRNEVLAFIERGLIDVSVSRANQEWGLRLPFDKSQVMYVWIDALINYLTVVGYPKPQFKDWWPPVHIVGKDIIKFHCIIWPAMLLSAGLELPKQVVAHGFFTVDGQKISKSLGNSINPLDVTETYGNDALRYYLLTEIPFGGDGNFSHERLAKVYQSDLANELGNLVQRVAKMLVQYVGGNLEENKPHTHDTDALEQAVADFHFEVALKDIWTRIRGLNQLIDAEKPWLLAKDDPEQLRRVLNHLVQDLLQIADLLEAFLPHTAAKIKQLFGGTQVDSSVGILFPRIEAHH